MKHKQSVKATIGIAVLVILLLVSNLAALAADPTWVAKASMGAARSHFQSPVVNGKIYAISGWNNSHPTSEVYDPTANTWTTIAPMSTERRCFEAVTINNKIYAIGGDSDGSNALSSVEVYDTTVNKWTTIAPMTFARENFKAVVIDGKIYVIGGFNGWMHCLSSVEVYDPTANTWTALAPMSHARADFETEVINGKIYAIGGNDDSTWNLSSVEVYDTTANTWTTLAPMSVGRCDFQTAVISSKIYVFGGYNGSNLSSVEVYDPTTNVWTTLSSLTTGRYNYPSAIVNGTMYAIGGQTSSTVEISSVEAYTPASTATITAPTDLSATAGDKQVSLKWTGVPGAESYNIYRAPTSGGPYLTKVNTNPVYANDIPYLNIGLQNDTTYYYVVTAVDSSGAESAYSNEASATPKAAAVSGKATLRVTMVTGEIKEYNVTADVAQTFITWFYGKAANSPYFSFEKTTDLGAYTSKTEYLAYDKISSFEVMKC